MVCGDTASFVDVQKLKGIHLAMKSGMLAGEVAAEALASGDFSAAATKAYEAKIESSFVKKETVSGAQLPSDFEHGIYGVFALDRFARDHRGARAL